MDLFGIEDNGATFSECGKHRLLLWRIWDKDKPKVMFIGLNPSTANADKDDPTIRRVKSFASSWGYGGVYMMNLFTFISTDPKKLNLKEGNLGHSDAWLYNISQKCEKIICAWGAFEVMGRDKEVRALLDNRYALEINQDGTPKHPLYVKSDTTPIRYK